MGKLNSRYNNHDVTNAVLNIIEREIINQCNLTNDVECISYKPHETGDEFNVVCVENSTNNGDAPKFAQNLCKWIEMTCVTTISIGVTYLNTQSDRSSIMWKDRANKYLYNAKNSGKNQV